MGFASCKAFRRSISASLPNPKPLPRGKGCVCFVGSASCIALRHTRPASVPGLYYWGYRPYSLSGALPLRPQFNNYEVYRQTDSVRLLKCVVEFLAYLLCRPSAFSVIAVYHYPAVSVHTARLFTAGHKHAYARTADYLRTSLAE